MATAYKDYYNTLGVGRDATQKDIKAAFRKLARKYHPDVNRNDKDAETRFKEINEAHEVLGDPEKRKKYDQLGPGWDRFQGHGGGGGMGAGGNVRYQTVTPEQLEEMFGRSDPFSDFFYNMFGRGAVDTAPAARAQRGEDVQGEAAITLEEAHSGTTRTVSIDGDRGRRQVQVRIPPGIKDGARVRASGQGASGRGGAGAGDLYIKVRIEPHPQFTRRGDDVRIRVDVPLDAAIAGGDVEVPTLRGTKVKLQVPPETQNGRVLRLRGLGMPKLRGDGHGDLLVEVTLKLPTPVPKALKDWAAAKEN